MVLSNSYEGARIKGTVGNPLPYVEVRIVDDNEQEIREIDVPGELRVKVSQYSCHRRNMITYDKPRGFSDDEMRRNT